MMKKNSALWTSVQNDSSNLPPLGNSVSSKHAGVKNRAIWKQYNNAQCCLEQEKRILQGNTEVQKRQFLKRHSLNKLKLNTSPSQCNSKQSISSRDSTTWVDRFHPDFNDWAWEVDHTHSMNEAVLRITDEMISSAEHEKRKKNPGPQDIEVVDVDQVGFVKKKHSKRFSTVRLPGSTCKMVLPSETVRLSQFHQKLHQKDNTDVDNVEDKGIEKQIQGTSQFKLPSISNQSQSNIHSTSHTKRRSSRDISDMSNSFSTLKRNSITKGSVLGQPLSSPKKRRQSIVD